MTHTSTSTQLEAVQQLADQLREQVSTVIVGKAEVIDLLLVALLCEGHVLLEDVPGVGKTTLARALASALHSQFRRIQFTPDVLPSDVTGLSFYNQKLGDFQFRPGPIFTNVLLADEINRATPRTQSALLEAMQERTVTLDGETHALPRPFLVLATQNPVELEGTFPLPEAQLDRFLMRIELGYPSAAEEGQIITRFTNDDPLGRVATVADTATVQELSGRTRRVELSDAVRDYIVALVAATRDHDSVELGASPRGSMALARAAQAWAAMQGRSFVVPDDVKRLARPVLAHRLILAPEARMRGVSPAELVSELLERVAAPVE